MSEAKKKSQSDEIVVNLDSFAVPGAIVIAGLIIAAAIFFTNKGKTSADVNGSNDTNNGENAGEEFTAARTTIDDDPFVGDKSKAKVAIVEFSDYQCPYCQRHAQETYPEIIKNYIDTGKAIYVFRDFPLSFHGQISIDTSEAAECVNEIDSGKFVEFHTKAFLAKDTAALAQIVKDLGIDSNKYNTCMSERRYKAEVEKDLKDGGDAGVQGTPGFVVGVLKGDGSVEGKMIAGAYPYATFSQVIDEMLAK